MAIERRRVFFRGRVQGVGFRITARRLAAGFPVAGSVRNLPDGRVELLVEGEPGAVAGLLDAIDREFAGPIAARDVADEPAGDPPLVGFSIR